jgi:hypothetical protein
VIRKAENEVKVDDFDLVEVCFVELTSVLKEINTTEVCYAAEYEDSAENKAKSKSGNS